MKKIPLSQGKYAIVDDADFAWLSKWKWCAKKTGRGWYVVRSVYKNGKQTIIQMHRLILNTPLGMETDHINHDGLDNRRANLRICTRTENNRNARKRRKPTSSQFKGVYWHKRYCKWAAQIMHNGKKIHLGFYDSEIEAARAYDRAALKYFCEFALTNFQMEKTA